MPKKYFFPSPKIRINKLVFALQRTSFAGVKALWTGGKKLCVPEGKALCTGGKKLCVPEGKSSVHQWEKALYTEGESSVYR
ncbi:MAG: hypothetical protein IAA81_09910 [Spirochaetes bacterium]|uniref:Uncharacterized protein n=1 Tax=Candidatus Gallitreponema excrementavium TaxID=2840840 RepID=A0A9D9N386_9SPIR|nr:hypothetical protein [Candidatus Gallitreponema excrementavium]